MTGTVEDTEEPAAEPGKRAITRRTIVVVAVVAVLVLAGAGTGIYFLTRGSGNPPAAGPSGAPGAGATPGSSGGSTAGQPSAQPGGSGGAPAETAPAETVAEQAVKAFNAHDATAMKKISCDQSNTDQIDNIPPGTTLELASPPEVTGDTATVGVKFTIGDTSTTIPLPLRKKDGTWCVD